MHYPSHANVSHLLLERLQSTFSTWQFLAVRGKSSLHIEIISHTRAQAPLGSNGRFGTNRGLSQMKSFTICQTNVNATLFSLALGLLILLNPFLIFRG